MTTSKEQGKGEALPKRDGCGICTRRADTFVCPDCKVMVYCSSEHQKEHSPAHQAACQAVVQAKQAMDQEEANIKENSGDDFFETYRAKFWTLPETQDYMTNRLKYAEALYAMGTRLGAEMKLENLLEMLHLNREDDLGLRFEIPYLFLRLERAQECYDFLWWWAVVSNDFSVNWRDKHQPFMDKTGADAFDKGDFFVAYYAEIGLALPLVLLKLKMRNDLRNLGRSRAGLSQTFPRELEEEVLKHCCHTDIIADNRRIIHADASYWKEVEKKLDGQIKMLVEWVADMKANFWNTFYFITKNGIQPSDTKLHLSTTNELNDCNHYANLGADAWREDANAMIELEGFAKRYLETDG